MTKAPACLILATCLLAACGNNEITPEPGEYQQTVKITELGFPGLEGEARSQMIEQMEAVGSGPESRFCMESEEGEGQWKEAASQMAGVLGGNCETTRDGGSASRLDVEMQCRGTALGDIKVTMAGTARTDGYDSQMAFDISNPQADQSSRLAMEIGAKRIGDCAG